jgi:two-component system chemotaxis response regulator CheY
MFAMVVDDSAAMRRLLSKILASLNWTVVAAGNGQEALRLLAEGQVCQLLLTDRYMPGMDGIELCREIRKDARYDTIRILMVTSDGALGSVNEAKAAGASDFLMKPFTPEILAERLTSVMAAA